MSPKPKNQKAMSPGRNQLDRFIETARELESDEDRGRFEEKLKQIAKAKPTRNPIKP